jgi:heat-inducible transcriptional repressor
MPKCEILSGHKEFIDKRFELINEMPEKIPAKAGEILSDLTHLPVIACIITPETAVIKKIELLNLSRNTVMLLVLTNDSRTRNRIFRLGDNITPQMIERFKEIANTKIKGKPLEELSVGYMQSLVASLGVDSFALMPLFTALFDTANEIESMSVDLSGVSRLYNVCGNEETARRIISLVDSRDPIISLFERLGDGVVFGKDTGFSELHGDTLIAAKFGNNKYKGYIAVIGRDRLSYEQIIPTIEYTANKLSLVLAKAQKDMED